MSAEYSEFRRVASSRPYFEATVDWRMWSFGVEVGLGWLSVYGRETCINVMLGPLTVEFGVVREGYLPSEAA